jgi:hypothetical protein
MERTTDNESSGLEGMASLLTMGLASALIAAIATAAAVLAISA